MTNKILVLGATGNIGKPLTDALVAKGERVKVKGELLIQMISSDSDLGVISKTLSKNYNVKVMSPMTTQADLYLVGNGLNLKLKDEGI